MKGFYKWIRNSYAEIISSIAFYPAIIAIGFLIMSWVMLEFDFSESGKHFKAIFSLIKLKDAGTARSIVSTILAGIISLTVFSFSMVMILLNQAASQMSNRMLENMIGNRFQQVILGFYIGTIVYALFLLSSIRDIDSGIYVPALSIYLLVLITVADIFLFIYFLHYVTQSVKFQTVIKRVHDKTLDTLDNICTTQNPEVFTTPATTKQLICMQKADYFQAFSKKELTKFACKHNGVIQFLHPAGTYLLKGQPLLNFYSSGQLSDDDIKQILFLVDFYDGQPLEHNPYYGYHQLAEVAIKALSPGINDPETAVLSIHALADLFYFRIHHFIKSVYKDDGEKVRIVTKEWSFEELFGKCFLPIWDYGKKDRYIQEALQQMIEQLKHADTNGDHLPLFNVFLNKIKEQKAKDNF